MLTYSLNTNLNMHTCCAKNTTKIILVNPFPLRQAKNGPLLHQMPDAFTRQGRASRRETVNCAYLPISLP